MSEQELAKDLGPLAALTIGVGTMIGAGIFVLPGEAVTTAVSGGDRVRRRRRHRTADGVVCQ